MEPANLFKEAVAAAKAGRRVEARDMLLELVEQEPQHELAWLWLSGLVDSLDDQIIALENALTINPDRPQVREQLGRLQQQRGETGMVGRYEPPPPDRFEEAMDTVRSGNRIEGRNLLRQLVADEPQHEQAWLALSQLADGIAEQIVILEKVVALNPHHTEAKKRLTELRQVYDDHIALGRAYEERGELEKALVEFRLAEKQSISSADRVIGKKRREAIEKRLQESRPVVLTSPTATLVRLSAGPPLLYGFLVFIQSGLNPLHLSPLLCIGEFTVVLGSMMLVAAGATPYHTAWQKLMGQKGLTAPARILVMAAGLFILLMPFLVFYLSAADRLAALRAGL